MFSTDMTSSTSPPPFSDSDSHVECGLVPQLGRSDFMCVSVSDVVLDCAVAPRKSLGVER